MRGGGGGGGGGGRIGLSLIQVTLLLSRTVVPITISMHLGRILSLGFQILLGFSLSALLGTTLDQGCRLLIGTIRFGFPKPSGGMLSLSGWPCRTDWLPRISFSSGVSSALYLVYFVVLMLKTGSTYSSAAISQPVFGGGSLGCVGYIELQEIWRTNSYG